MKHNKLFLSKILFVFAAATLLCASCGKSDNKATTMYLVKTTGNVGVEDEDEKPVALHDNLGLYSGYGLESQSDSFAWIDLDDTKLAKMDEKSKVGIVKDDKELVISVNSGSLFFNVTEPLKDDESMDIRTSTMICGIRGTCGWVTVGDKKSCLYLVDGTVECMILMDGHDETVTLNEKECLIVEKDGDNVTYEIRQLSFDDVPAFVQDEIVDELFVQEEAPGDNTQTEDNAQLENDDQPEGDVDMPDDSFGRLTMDCMMEYTVGVSGDMVVPVNEKWNTAAEDAVPELTVLFPMKPYYEGEIEALGIATTQFIASNGDYNFQISFQTVSTKGLRATKEEDGGILYEETDSYIFDVQHYNAAGEDIIKYRGSKINIYNKNTGVRLEILLTCGIEEGADESAGPRYSEFDEWVRANVELIKSKLN